VRIPKLTIAFRIAPATVPADTLRFRYTNKRGRNDAIAVRNWPERQR
jgi:hypothetical protein